MIKITFWFLKPSHSEWTSSNQIMLKIQHISLSKNVHLGPLRAHRWAVGMLPTPAYFGSCAPVTLQSWWRGGRVKGQSSSSVWHLQCDLAWASSGGWSDVQWRFGYVGTYFSTYLYYPPENWQDLSFGQWLIIPPQPLVLHGHSLPRPPFCLRSLFKWLQADIYVLETMSGAGEPHAGTLTGIVSPHRATLHSGPGSSHWGSVRLLRTHTPPCPPNSSHSKFSGWCSEATFSSLLFTWSEAVGGALGSGKDPPSTLGNCGFSVGDDHLASLILSFISVESGWGHRFVWTRLGSSLFVWPALTSHPLTWASAASAPHGILRNVVSQAPPQTSWMRSFCISSLSCDWNGNNPIYKISVVITALWS